MKTLTIAVQTYNRSRYLMEMLESILSQTLGQFEVVVWNNASTDNTVELVNALGDPRVTIHTHPVNIGASNNANAAILACQTDYLLLTHDDDRLKPNMVARYMERVGDRTDLSLVCCNADFIDSEGEVVEKAFLNHRYPFLSDLESGEGGFARDYVSGRNYIVCPTVMLNVKTVRDAGLLFRSDVGPAMDSYFWCSLCFLPGRFVFLQEALYEYRLHQQQDSHLQGTVLITKLRTPLGNLLHDHDPALSRNWKKVSWGHVYEEWRGRSRNGAKDPGQVYKNQWQSLKDIETYTPLEKLQALLLATGEFLWESLRELRKKLLGRT